MCLKLAQPPVLNEGSEKGISETLREDFYPEAREHRTP